MSRLLSSICLLLAACNGGDPTDSAPPAETGSTSPDDTSPPDETGDSTPDDTAPPGPGDYTDPIERVASVEIEDEAELTDGVLVGDLLVLTGQHRSSEGGVWVYDLSAGGAPQATGQLSTWHVQRVCADGDDLWGMDRGGTLYQIAIEGGVPEIVDATPRGSFGEGVDCDAGRVAWGLGSGGGGGYALTPEGVDSPIQLEGEVRDVLWRGDALWTLHYDALRAWTPGESAPSALGEAALDGVCQDMAAGDDWIAVACGSAGVQIVSDDGGAPQVLGAWSGHASARAVAVQGDRVLVAAWTELIWLDVSDPSAPAFVASERANTSMMAAVAGEEWVYAVDWGQPFAVALHEEAAPEVRPSVHSARPGELVSLFNDGPVDLWLGEPNVGELSAQTVPPGEAAIWTLPDPLESEPSVATDDPDETELTLPLTADLSGIQPGDEAPPLAEYDTYGALWELEALRGEVVFLGMFSDG